MRLASGGEIDRGTPLAFRFDGADLEGYAGDTLASALLANDVQPLARSFKYHRPRGLLAAAHEEPNAVLDLRHGAYHDPNARATLELLAAGMELRSVHARGTAQRDALAFLDRCWRFIPAGFYYKTFMWPGWKWFEPAIRRMAGRGVVDPSYHPRAQPQRYLNADLCVIGAGAAGLAAAQAGLRRGLRVVLVEQRTRCGGTLLWRSARIDGEPAMRWVAAVERELRSGGAEVLLCTTALGLYDHGLLALSERMGDATGGARERVWQLRARQVVLASGAIERPLLFGDNDRPGVMLADSALEYLRRYAVRAGERVVVATGNDSAYAVAEALQAAGARCVLVDARADGALAAAARTQGIEVRANERVACAVGRDRVRAVRLASGATVEADLVAMAGGWTPLIHLYCHARGRPRWDAARGAMLPGDPVHGLAVAGAANGADSLQQALEQGVAAAGGAAGSTPRAEEAAFGWGGEPDIAQAFTTPRVWVDLQHDVTVKDVALAVRENFSAAEHLKRYTTLGMATDQGRTSNVNGLAVLADRTGREISTLGVTTFRPPFVPVGMAALAGADRGELQAPLRRLPAENVHRAEGAALLDYGNLLRPAWYGDRETALARECRAARTEAVVLDASSLGKIEVLGPDAAALLDFVFYTRMSTLAPGRLRYGLALAESGGIFDDAVVLCVSPRHFVVSCSSGHVAAMVANLEAWREDRFDLARVFVHDATPQWATLAISGPQARRVISALELGIDLADGAFLHMSARDGVFAGVPARIARVSFTGERGYEVSVPADRCAELWGRAREAGARPLGVEALGVLRVEKGYIFVGQDTDGETMPQDIGMGQARLARQDAFVGDRSLFLPAAARAGRRQLVGVSALGEAPLAVGAHAVVRDGASERSIGFVTSSYFSILLGRPIALALIEDGAARHGETLEFEHLGARSAGRLVPPCLHDPRGERLNA